MFCALRCCRRPYRARTCTVPQKKTLCIRTKHPQTPHARWCVMQPPHSPSSSTWPCTYLTASFVRHSPDHCIAVQSSCTLKLTNPRKVAHLLRPCSCGKRPACMLEGRATRRIRRPCTIAPLRRPLSHAAMQGSRCMTGRCACGCTCMKGHVALAWARTRMGRAASHAHSLERSSCLAGDGDDGCVEEVTAAPLASTIRGGPAGPAAAAWRSCASSLAAAAASTCAAPAPGPGPACSPSPLPLPCGAAPVAPCAAAAAGGAAVPSWPAAAAVCGCGGCGRWSREA